MLDLIKIRHELHSIAEISGKEEKTSNFIIKALERLKPDSIQVISGSVVAVFKGKVKGKTTAFRADMDALPASESKRLSYKSKNPKVSHLCGHDGHSAILLGLGEKISSDRPEKGKIVLIFQSAEETGHGAKKLISNKAFKELKIDEIYGFHNIPGYDVGKILLKDGVFASASTGMTIKFTGKTSHASQPEKGISPVPAISWLIRYLDKITADQKKYFKSKVLITIVGLKAGKKDFGISPDKGELYLTLRACSDDDIQEMIDMIEAETRKVSDMSGLIYKINFQENFSAVENDHSLTEKLKDLCKNKSIKYEILKEAFTWSEDFSYFGNIATSCFIGIGSGKDHAPLHSAEYDFCDKIIGQAVNLLFEMTKSDSD